MQGAHQTRTPGVTTRPGEGSIPVMPSETRALPGWESFPPEDRHRLVRTILQAARRQVEARPASGRPGR
jgi:hypothetical protein